MMDPKIVQAKNILMKLGLPKRQQNDRSALTLLALLDLKPDDHWKDCGNPMIGITPMMEFFKKHYNKRYAPNSRETVRRQTVHQFLQAGLIIENPDRPDRPTNSGKTVYQVSGDALKLFASYGTDAWSKHLKQFLLKRPSLVEQYGLPRKLTNISLRTESGKLISLSPGRHSELIWAICIEFRGRFEPDGKLLYIGDTSDKFAHFDKTVFERLHIDINPHGKMPDVIIYSDRLRWLFLIEAVTSHGPIDTKRRRELDEIFAGSTAGIVYVTAFADKKTMRKYITDISWETEVWVASAPDHLIHFDGTRFLGPY